MQRYDHYFKTMFSLRFLMFKMRDLMHFEPLFTDFKHFEWVFALFLGINELFLK